MRRIKLDNVTVIGILLMIFGFSLISAQTAKADRFSEAPLIDEGTVGNQILERGSCGDTLVWTLDSNGLLMISGTGSMTSHPWTADDIKHVIIEDGVSSIAESAFGGCTSLTDIEIASSVTLIGYKAFFGCTGITSIAIPGIKEFGNSVFSGCSNLQKITLSESYFPKNKNTNAHRAFEGLRGTKEIVIGSMSINIDVTNLQGCGKCGENAYWFLDSSKLSVYGFGAMYNYDRGYGYSILATMPWVDKMYNIQEFIVHEGITRIGAYTLCAIDQTLFNKSFYFPASLTSIDGSAFYCVDGAEVYYIPNGDIMPGNYGGYRFNWHKPGGDCGEEANWNMDNENTIVLSGPGPIMESSWPDYIKNASTIVVTESVTGIGANALIGLDNIRQIIFLGNPPAIDNSAFLGRTMNAYYRHGLNGWTAEKYHGYGGNIIWKQYCSWDNNNLVLSAVTYHEAHAASCTEKGNTDCWICNACGQGFTTQNATDYLDESEYILPAHGHDWGEIKYLWSIDNTSVTATRVCQRDETHMETETKEVLMEITASPTCDEMGETTYTAFFDNDIFEVQTKTLADIPPLGHDWLETAYAWSEDNSIVTAMHICARDESHIGVETVIPILSVAQSPTDDLAGSTCFTAVFEQEGFDEQTKVVEGDIPALSTIMKLVFPGKLLEIEKEAFAGINCEAVLIPDGCETIDSKAFAGCTKLIYVRIPATVKFVAEDAFEGSKNVRVERIE